MALATQWVPNLMQSVNVISPLDSYQAEYIRGGLIFASYLASILKDQTTNDGNQNNIIVIYFIPGDREITLVFSVDEKNFF